MGMLKALLKKTGNENASVAIDGLYSDKTAGWIDTGSYAFNAAMCASIYGGIPKDKIIGLAGEEATGKSFYALAIADNFLKDNPTGEVCIFDTEHAISKSMLESRKLPLDRVAVSPVSTVEDFSHEALSLLNAYEAIPEKERQPLMLICDSLGNLSTKKELRDIAAGSDTKDMTRTQLIKAAFRVLTTKLGVLGVPMIVTGHVYAVIGSMYPTKALGSGCLVAGTEIQTPEGIKVIEDLKPGDLVNTLFGALPVSEAFVFTDKAVYEIELDDGSKIKCSGDHKFLIDGEWKTVTEIMVSVKNTDSINIDVADMKGPIDVYREQIQQNL